MNETQEQIEQVIVSRCEQAAAAGLIGDALEGVMNEVAEIGLSAGMNLKSLMRAALRGHMMQALKLHKGDKSKTGRYLGIHRNTIDRTIKQLGLGGFARDLVGERRARTGRDKPLRKRSLRGSTELQLQAIRLKLSGLSYRQIAEQMGFSQQRAQALVMVKPAVRQEVMRLHGHRCADCSVRIEPWSGKGHIHHDRITATPEEYNSLGNLVFLCCSCHTTRHKREGVKAEQ